MVAGPRPLPVTYTSCGSVVKPRVRLWTSTPAAPAANAGPVLSAHAGAYLGARISPRLSAVRTGTHFPAYRGTRHGGSHQGRAP